MSHRRILRRGASADFTFMLAHFSHFFDILTHLKLSCNFLMFFKDFSSSFGGFGVVWGWILGGFFDDF